MKSITSWYVGALGSRTSSLSKLNVLTLFGTQSLQLGQTNTEHTKYYLYWVPAQYTKAIRNSVLGTFD